MSIKYKCVECGVSMKIKDELAGTKGKCPKCRTAFQVPGDVPEEIDSEPDVETEDVEAEDVEGDDEMLDIPVETTPVVDLPPEVTPPPENVPTRPASRRVEASKKKATRISSDSVSSDPTDVLFESDTDAGVGVGAGVEGADAAGSASMAELFRDFTPAGGGKSNKKKNAGSGVSTAGSAAALLARSAEEKKTKSSEFDTFDGEDEGQDWKENLKDLWQQFGLYISGFLVVVVGLYFVMMSLTSTGGGEDIELLDVTGKIITDGGAPVENARVQFLPNDINVKGSGASGTTNAQGEFELMYDADTEGAPVGKYKVIILSADGRTLGTSEQTIRVDGDNYFYLSVRDSVGGAGGL